jgi:hypothetical protein
MRQNSSECTARQCKLHGGVKISQVNFCTNLGKEKGKLLPSQTMKAYRGAEVQLHSSLTSVLDGGKWSTSHPGWFTPRKEPQYPLNMKLGGPQSWSGHYREEKNLLLLPQFKPLAGQSVA